MLAQSIGYTNSGPRFYALMMYHSNLTRDF
jgi:hypothetical protein